MICNTFKDIFKSNCGFDASVMRNIVQFPYFSQDRVSKDKKHHVSLHYLRDQNILRQFFAHKIKIIK